MVVIGLYIYIYTYRSISLSIYIYTHTQTQLQHIHTQTDIRQLVNFPTIIGPALRSDQSDLAITWVEAGGGGKYSEQDTTYTGCTCEVARTEAG